MRTLLCVITGILISISTYAASDLVKMHEALLRKATIDPVESVLNTALLVIDDESISDAEKIKVRIQPVKEMYDHEYCGGIPIYPLYRDGLRTKCEPTNILRSSFPARRIQILAVLDEDFLSHTLDSDSVVNDLIQAAIKNEQLAENTQALIACDIVRTSALLSYCKVMPLFKRAKPLRWPRWPRWPDDGDSNQGE